LSSEGGGKYLEKGGLYGGAFEAVELLWQDAYNSSEGSALKKENANTGKKMV